MRSVFGFDAFQCAQRLLKTSDQAEISFPLFAIRKLLRGIPAVKMEWSGSLDGEGTDYSTTSSPPRRSVRFTNGLAAHDNARECDSMSEEMDDDLSDDFSIPDSEEEDDRRGESPRREGALKLNDDWDNSKTTPKPVLCIFTVYVSIRL